MMKRKNAREFASAEARKRRAILYRWIATEKHRAMRQILQMHVRFAHHDGWSEYLAKLT